MEKLVFFGATGNSGRQLLEYLVNLGRYEIYGVGRKDLELPDSVCYVKGDITSLEVFDRLPKQVDVIINFAGVQPSILPYSEETDFKLTMEAYIDINIKGVWNVLEYARVAGIKSYLYATSHRDIEGAWVGEGIPLKEDIPINVNYQGDHSMYAISKSSAMMIGDYYGTTFNFNVYTLRFPMIFSSPKTNWYYSNGIRKTIPFVKILHDASLGRTLEVWGDPGMKRDYVYIENMYSIVKELLKGLAPSGVYNVGTQEGVTTEQFISTIAEIFNPEDRRSEIVYRPDKHTYKSTTYSIEKCRKHLGYSPVLLRDMLKDIKRQLDENQSFNKWNWDHE